MKITDIRLDVIDNPRGKLRAFCSLTLNEQFVVKNFKVIEGEHGLFVAMPSRKLTKPCYECDNRVFRNANYCDRCGSEFDDRGKSGNYKSGDSHADIAFPIEDDFRERLEDMVIDAYRKRKEEGSGSRVEHRKDEDYDLLDFDYNKVKEEQAEEKEGEPSRAASGGSFDPTDEPQLEDIFSDPARSLQSHPRSEPGKKSGMPFASAGNGTPESESSESEEDSGSPYY